MILFFETYSIIQVLLLFSSIRRSEIIYFNRRAFPPLKHNGWSKKGVLKIIKLLNRDVKIELLPIEKVNECTWVMNKRAISIAEKLAPEILRGSAYKTILKIVRDDNILKCYKAQLVNDVSARLLFYKMAEHMGRIYKNDILAVPAEIDSHFEPERLLIGDCAFRLFMRSSGSYRLRAAIKKAYAVALITLLPFLYVMMKSRKITFRRINKKRYDIGMPFIFGFHRQGERAKDITGAQDDGYLYRKGDPKGSIIHIFSYWRRPREFEEEQKKVMSEKNLPFADKREYKMTLSFVKKVLKMQFDTIAGSFRSAFYKNDRSDYVLYSARILFWILEKYLEFANIDYKVEFIRNDFSPISIISTILCNQNEKKTVAIQHAASPYDLPVLSYSHFDKYIVYGDMYADDFSQYWEGLELVKTGRERVDYAVNILNNKETMSDLKDRYAKLYPARRYTAVIAMSGDVERNPRSQWDKMYGALRRLKTDCDVDFNLFLRFRDAKRIRASENMSRFAELSEKDERIIVDHTNFSTYELMALCDVFIACNLSFCINEAIATGARVFTFDLHGRVKYILRDRASAIILNTEDDIIKVFNGLRDNFSEFNCDWEFLRRYCNYHDDGRNLERIQEAVWSLVGQESDCEAKI